ncbi:MAG: hypothetical protein KAS64_06740 [Spirochaetes bacterium]|nr:hypothetical protein [Spirochaetota bacterium]
MKQILIYPLFFLSISLTGFIYGAEQQQSAQKMLDSRVKELHKLMVRYKKQLGKVASFYFKVIKYAENGRLQFIAKDFSVKKEFDSEAYFSSNIKDKTRTVILVKKRLLTQFKTQPSIVYSILIHELHHAYDYYKQRKHFIGAAKKIHFEKVLYEFDACISEAIFIAKVLIPEKYKLTKFETFLYKSHKAGHIFVFAAYILGVDIQVIFNIYNEYMSASSLKKTFNKFIFTGKRLLGMYKKAKKSKNKTQKYYTIIALKTYIKYTPSLFVETIRKKSGYAGPPKRIYMNYHPPFEKLYYKIEGLLLKNKDWIKYGDKFRKIVQILK